MDGLLTQHAKLIMSYETWSYRFGSFSCSHTKNNVDLLEILLYPVLTSTLCTVH